MSDFYETLGVSRDATADQIKKAYRRMAMQYHPDVASEEGAAEKFKAVQEAYDVLSDPNKKAIYDRGGDPNQRGGFGGGFPGGGFGGFGGGGFGSFFDAMRTASSHGPRSRVRRGQDGTVRLRIDLHEAAFGATKQVKVDTAVLCPRCTGSGAQEGSKPETCTTCRGQGEVISVVSTILGDIHTARPCPRCQGFGTIIPHPCTECDGDGRIRSTTELSVKVPPGAHDRLNLRMAGRGEVGPGGGEAGDLYVELSVNEHPVFRRDGDNLEMVVKVPMTAAALGTTMTIKTLEADWPESDEADRTVELEVPAGTQSGTRVTIDGRGIRNIQTGRTGDIGVTFLVETPTRLNEEQRELLRRLASLREETSVDPYAQHRREKGGVFGRLFKG
ncbi:molecular chaperone DnaJ [Mariniluteicoccus endophyticus]